MRLLFIRIRRAYVDLLTSVSTSRMAFSRVERRLPRARAEHPGPSCRNHYGRSMTYPPSFQVVEHTPPSPNLTPVLSEARFSRYQISGKHATECCIVAHAEWILVPKTTDEIKVYCIRKLAASFDL